MYRSIGKTLFDYIIVLLSAPGWLLLIGLTAIAVRVKLGKPVFFKQSRSGKDGQEFVLIKFRSMTDERDEAGILLPDEKRLPRFGKFLRSSSLDELPEMINILKGEMSLIGPRPLLVRYLDRYDDFQKRRLEVKPGISGWAQINGRNDTNWDDRFSNDVWYVDNLGLLLDIKIIASTISKVFKREGISQDGQATISEFNPQ